MTRIVHHQEQAPLRIPMAEVQRDLYLCRCGLSQNGAFCDGSHKATRDETPGVNYRYSRAADGALQREVTG